MRRFRARQAAAALLGAALACASLAQDTRAWPSLEKDGIHDPKSPAVKLLQQPGEALSRLAPDNPGNQVRWVEALQSGQIAPRTRLNPETSVELRETEIYLNLRGGSPIVKFPHRPHTQWLACANCHDQLFRKAVGETPIDMKSILEGNQCGLCHGAVAFPLTECNRCHNTSRVGFQRPPGTAPDARAALVPR
ncbi:MAG TPA: c(7)-type cytochrome triheme domain-containing protein [Usitatibacter sp.]|nr:c(7)-type cytochrome triheme domain-containing protein [Usitatibacter sp.]